ncbi:MAG: V-type ATP synthase subunit I [Methanobacteriaceae archaeon]|nr:V-type ATP synthase subunit I [Methanobacteriaceae archaeon]MDP2837130.1 V-type ATP synthase subunit I [Methanobacteriaceae archaeon]MDP3624087.1 V-type ATP synthase subunit I [Methanobacteriaceae archaeon]
MFLPARMRKLKIITLDQYADSTVRSLHEEGIVQIHDISERIQQDAEWAQILKPSKVTPQTGKIASLLMKTTGLADFLGTAVPKKSMMQTVKGFINPPVFEKREVEELDTDGLVSKAESVLSQVESLTKGIEEKLAALDSEKSEIETNLSVSEKLINFDADLSELTSSEFVSIMAGKISLESYNKFQDESAKVTDELIVLEANGDAKTEKTIIIITLKKYGEDIAGILRRIEFERFEISGLSGKPKDIISSSNSRLEAIAPEREAAVIELQEVSAKWEDELLVLKEQLEIEKERNEIFASFGETEKTVMFEAWVSEKKQESALEVIEKSTDGHSVVESEDPEDENEVPVLQDNPRFAKPYENFVEMYSPLKYNEIDPTILMAIVFPFFFGFCLTDAGYGIIDALLGYVLYRGLGKVNPFMKNFGIILIACGVWAFILGMVTNGFIGDLFPRWFLDGAAIPTTIAALDAFVNPQNILIFGLIVGVIHINMGLVIGAINNIRANDFKEALGTQLVWIILELGIVLYVLGGMFIGGPVILLALLILIYSNGLFGILDISGFLGTLLSYARLLALCLSTGGIAFTVNILTGLSYEMLPIIGVILAPIVFIGGHIANLAFQSLGAFINSLRLHYVEFFSQFYMGGKIKFEAFRAERSFTKIRR